MNDHVRRANGGETGGADDPRLRVSVGFEPRFCANHIADLTAGCSFGCIYCPFADLSARSRGVTQPTALDATRISEIEAPPTLFLSPGSDPFAPQAATATHTLLEHVLPRGSTVAIVTKGVIPERTVKLLAAHRERVEGIGVGVTSLDDGRNRILEPGCPPAALRLAQISHLALLGLPVLLRIDPLFPLIDDAPSALAALVEEGAQRSAIAISASYVFAWGRYLRRMRRVPLLADSVRQLTERTPMEGGTALSLPLARKIETYRLLQELATSNGLWFNTCGCKDLRIRAYYEFFSYCGNVLFLKRRAEQMAGR